MTSDTGRWYDYQVDQGLWGLKLGLLIGFSLVAGWVIALTVFG